MLQSTHFVDSDAYRARRTLFADTMPHDEGGHHLQVSLVAWKRWFNMSLLQELEQGAAVAGRRGVPQQLHKNDGGTTVGHLDRIQA